MKKLFIWLVFLSMFSIGLKAQTNLSSANSCAMINATGLATVGIQVTGTWATTLQPQVSINGNAAVNAQVTPSTSTTPQSTITADGVYVANVAGYDLFQVCFSSYSSGTATITFRPTTLVNASLFGGGGSGSFTAAGDLSGSSTSQTVVGVEGAAIPTSASYLGTNSSGQLVAATNPSNGTVTSVTFTGDGTLLSSTPSSAVTTTGTVTASLANAAGGSVLNNASVTPGAPSYTATPTLGGVGVGTGTITYKGTTSGSGSLGCTSATCTTLGTTAAFQIGKMSNVNSIATTGNTGVAAVRASPAVVTIGSGTSIGSTSLCAAAVCTAGLYNVNAYIDLTTACGSTGTYQLNLIYTDDQGAKTIVVPLMGTGVTSSVLGLATVTNFATVNMALETTGGAAINYSTTAGACGTGGPMVGKMYLSVTSAN